MEDKGGEYKIRRAIVVLRALCKKSARLPEKLGRI